MQRFWGEPHYQSTLPTVERGDSWQTLALVFSHPVREGSLPEFEGTVVAYLRVPKEYLLGVRKLVGPGPDPFLDLARWTRHPRTTSIFPNDAA
jgi:hypothetical protein